MMKTTDNGGWLPLSGTHAKRIGQVSSLYVSLIVSMGIAFVTSIVNTRTLGASAYGDFKFINNVFGFLATIATLGLFVTGSQMLAPLSADSGKRHGLVGALIWIAGIISAAFVGVTAIFALLEPEIFAKDLKWELLLFSPLVAVSIFQPCLENIYQGENRIHEFSLFRIVPAAAFLLALLGLSVVMKLDLPVTLALQLVAMGGTTIFFLRRLRPKLSQIGEYRNELWSANKQYGWQVYIGMLSNVATAYLSTFMISYFLDNANVGYFSLAVTLTMPLTQISSVVGTTYFKDFAMDDELPGKVTRAMGAVAALTLVLFLLVIRPVVLLVYTRQFEEVILLAQLISVGAVLHGLGDYFNRFLGAHGRGKELRNGAFVVGFVNVFGYLLLIRLYGIEGAAVARLIASSTYCAMMVWYYRSFRRYVIRTQAA